MAKYEYLPKSSEPTPNSIAAELGLLPHQVMVSNDVETGGYVITVSGNLSSGNLTKLDALLASKFDRKGK